MKSLKIDNFEINDMASTFVIAEAGVNHNGNLNLAKKLCNAAKEAGADAVKFQTWKTEQLLTPDVGTADYQKMTTDQESQFEMLKKLELSFDDFSEIFDYCKKIGIIFLSTPGDEASADFLDELGISIFKIGSDDLDNLPLIKHIAQKRKPLIISTGMSTLEEVKETYDFIKRFNNKIIFLHCTSSYPTEIKDVNLKAMLNLKQNLGTFVGYSDHTTNIWIPAVAVCIGAKVIEKHLTLDKNSPGPDHMSSLDKSDFINMVNLIRKVEKSLKNRPINPDDVSEFIGKLYNKKIVKKIKIALGSYEKKPTDSEKKIMNIIKKTVVATTKIKKGEKLLPGKISIKRAGKISLKPKEYFNLLNKIAKVDIEKYEIIDYEKIT